MKKHTSKETFERAVKNEKHTRANYTFRLEVELMNKYKRLCKQRNVSMSTPIEQFLKDLFEEQKN